MFRMVNKAAFLDRDGVIIYDVDNLTDKSQIKLIPRSAEAIMQLNDSGYIVVIVTNQPIIARGMITEKDLSEIHKEMERQIAEVSGGKINAIYYCPHHPNANVEKYKKTCECRKPSPGMILSAAAEHEIDLFESFMVGDRQSDILAGNKARVGMSIQVQTGMHDAKPIHSGNITVEEMNDAEPDLVCDDLYSAVEFVLKMEGGK